jgi:hypothetical protein
MAGTLIRQLRQGLNLTDHIHPSIAGILSHPESHPTVTVATMNVPEVFDYALACYGFRILGLLSEILPRIEKPTPEFHFRREISAVHTDKNPVTKQFQETWSSCWKIDLENFFIIIFIENSATAAVAPTLVATAPVRRLFVDSPSSNAPSPFQKNNTPSPHHTNNTPSPLEFEFEDSPNQLQGEPSHLSLRELPQGRAYHVPLTQSLLTNHHFNSSPSFSTSTQDDPSQPLACSPQLLFQSPITAGHSMQMHNSPSCSFTGSPRSQSINSSAWDDTTHPPFPFSDSTYLFNLDSPLPQSVSSLAGSPIPEASDDQMRTAALYPLAASLRPHSVNSLAGSPVPETADNQMCAAIMDQCRLVGCSEELIQEAICKTKNKEFGNSLNGGTLGRILNYLAMVEVLIKMGFSSTATDPTEVKHHCHGVPLTCAGLLRTFHWSIHSFKHKRTYYSWPEQAAQNMRWNPLISPEGKACCRSCLCDPD